MKGTIQRATAWRKKIIADAKHHYVFYAFLIAVAIIPTLIIENLSAQYAERIMFDRAAKYASIVADRNSKLAYEFIDAISVINKTAVDEKVLMCSDQMHQTFARVVLTHPHLLSVGYIKDNKIMCADFGTYNPPRQVTQDVMARVTIPNMSYTIRLNAHISEFNNNDLIIYESDDGVAIIVSNTVHVDITTEPDDISLGVYSIKINTFSSGKGVLKPEWAIGHTKANAVFRDNGFIVATQIAGLGNNILAISAIPIKYLNELKSTIRVISVPTGVLAGIALSCAIYFYRQRRSSIKSQIKSGLLNDEFYLEYQPVIDLKTNKYIGAEALIRWRTSTGENIPPDIFIPVAEEHKLIGQITDRVFELVGKDVSPLFKLYPNFHIAINVSSSDILYGKLSNKINKLSTQLSLSPNNFIIEATERELLNSIVINEHLNNIRVNGSTIAIDDFGTGYSSLSYLGNFDLDFLKIDKSFVSSIGTDSATSKVITHIIGIAKSLNLKMIAEGIEEQYQADYLLSNNVEFGQGWLFSRSLRIEQLIIFLNGKV